MGDDHQNNGMGRGPLLVAGVAVGVVLLLINLFVAMAGQFGNVSLGMVVLALAAGVVLGAVVGGCAASAFERHAMLVSATVAGVLTLPLWVPALLNGFGGQWGPIAAGVMQAVAIMCAGTLGVRWIRRGDPRRCPRCGYARTGLPRGAACPECGDGAVGEES